MPAIIVRCTQSRRMYIDCIISLHQLLEFCRNGIFYPLDSLGRDMIELLSALIDSTSRSCQKTLLAGRPYSMQRWGRAGSCLNIHRCAREQDALEKRSRSMTRSASFTRAHIYRCPPLCRSNNNHLYHQSREREREISTPNDAIKTNYSAPLAPCIV